MAPNGSCRMRGAAGAGAGAAAAGRPGPWRPPAGRRRGAASGASWGAWGRWWHWGRTCSGCEWRGAGRVCVCGRTVSECACVCVRVSKAEIGWCALATSGIELETGKQF